MSNNLPKNEEIAGILDHIADLLDTQDANPYRIKAYRDGANTIRSFDKPIAKIAIKDGKEELESIPDIGEAIANIIITYVNTGRSEMLDELLSKISPRDLFNKVPGIGEELSQRIVDNLGISTLEDLEQAAYDGRLKKIDGFGDKKVKNIQVSLAGMLSTSTEHLRRRSSEQKGSAEQPDVEILLGVDEKYRSKAEANKLRKIAPKRFNPNNKAWLPILNTKEQGWDFTALYSNTALAHNLNKIHDWVVIYYERGSTKGQNTVVTESKGPLEGKRVIRGREAECRDYYDV